MKRWMIIGLTMVLIMTAAGCSSTQGLQSENTGGKQETTAKSVDESGIKVGFVLPSGSDATDTASYTEEIRQMQYELGLTDNQVLIESDVSKSDSADVLDSLAEQDCRIVFACDKKYESAAVEAAKVHPDVEFCVEDGKKAKKSGQANLHNYYVRLYEGYYAAGQIAGMKLNDMLNRGNISSDNCLIGFVANRESPETYSCANAFYLGVEEVCSQSTMYVRYTDKTANYDADAESAQQLVAAGAGFMTQSVSTTAVAVICAESDVPIVGNEVNVIDCAPSEAITSVKSVWSVYYTYAVDCALNGEDIDTDWCGGYAEGAVTLTQLNDEHLVDGTTDRLMEAEKALRNGTAKIFDTEKFTVNGQSLTELAAGDSAYSKYARYISDGEYKESSTRSAPTMGFFIDGVEESTYNYLSSEESDDYSDYAEYGEE